MKRRRVLAAVASATSAGCAGAFPSRSTTRTRPTIAPTTADRGDTAFTYGAPSGNRVAPGRADLGATERVDVELSGRPAWVVAAPSAVAQSEDESESAGSTWVVAHADGTLEAVAIEDGDARIGTMSPPSLPAGTPPALSTATNRVLVPPAGASTLTHPTPTPAGPVVVHEDGTLAVDDRTHAVDALPDGRVVVGDDRAAVLAGATRQYDHGALGSRNLDAARAMDADDDERVELVVPTDDGRNLAVLERTRDGVREVDAVGLPDRLAGNLATATVHGVTALGAITRQGLHVWPA